MLSRHSTRALVLALAIGALPFVFAVFFYERAPRFFDIWASAEVGVVVVAAFWFLFYRFMWKRDLIFFHASVPRIGAGIIVGYLPVFLIDEVWDLAEQSLFYILIVITLLGSTTLLYLYVEVQRRLGETDRGVRARARHLPARDRRGLRASGSWSRACSGRFMAVRNWGRPVWKPRCRRLREALPPFAGQLPTDPGRRAASRRSRPRSC